MKLIKKLFNKIFFAVIVAFVFSLINRCEVKAYTINQDTGSPYFTTDGVNANDISSLYESISADAIGGFSYGCDNTFESYEVLQTYEDYLGSYCYYFLNETGTNNYLFGINPMQSYNNNEPQSLFLKINVPSGYTFASTTYNNTLSVILFPDDHQPTLYLDGGNFEFISNYDNTFYFNLRVNSATPYLTTRYFISAVQLNNTKYITSMFFKGFKQLYNNGLDYANDESVVEGYGYFSNKLITWPTSNGDEIFDSSIITGPSIDFETRNIKIGDYITSVEVKSIFRNYSDAYQYYYQYTSLGNIPSDNGWVRLYYENITHIDNLDYFIYQSSGPGILYFEIYDYTNMQVYGNQIVIDNIQQPDPEILFNVNYNSGNTITIDEVLIDITYLTYKKGETLIEGDTQTFVSYVCQYRFIPDNTSDTSSIEWSDTNCDDGRLYVAHSNGTLQARVLIEQGVVVGEQVDITEYGALVSDMYGTSSGYGYFNSYLNSNGLTGLFSSSSGPLQNIVSLPLRLGVFIYQFFNAGTSVCQPYDMGTIFGRHLVIGCVDLSYLGSNLLRVIDMIFAGAFSITWLMFLYKLFRKIVLLKELNIIGMVKGGIF